VLYSSSVGGGTRRGQRWGWALRSKTRGGLDRRFASSVSTTANKETVTALPRIALLLSFWYLSEIREKSFKTDNGQTPDKPFLTSDASLTFECVPSCFRASEQHIG